MLAEVKWIKITTDIFNDEKIKIIDTYPARNEILVIWFKLLALAGKSNQDGFLFMNNKIPYTKEMLSAIFNRELKSIQMALTIFQNFGMIEITDNEIISITNWEKHQNIDGLDKIKEQTRKRVAKHREKKAKLLNCNVTNNVTVTNGNAIEEEREEDKEVDKDIDIYIQIKNLYNEQCSSLNSIKVMTDKRKGLINARLKEHGMEAIKEVIKNASESDFLKGDNNKGWMADFDWIMRPTNFVKVLEGKYINREDVSNSGKHKGTNSKGNEQGKTQPGTSKSMGEDGYNTTDAADKVIERYGDGIDTSDLEDLPF